MTTGANLAEAGLQMSTAIARQLVDDAVWSAGRCTWMGAEPMEQRVPGTAEAPLRSRLTYRALGPDLYAGTSGVARYLAEFAAGTGDADARRTALGALRHALSRHEDVAPQVRMGFYVGWPGIADTAIRVGNALDVPELTERGHDLARQCARQVENVTAPRRDEPGEFDLIAGAAGGVVGLLACHRRTGDEQLLAGAWGAADGLVRSARRSEIGWSWRSPELRTRHDLTGLSHGAAGAALALVEMYRATGERAFAEAASEAMRYENHWLDPSRGNWPDFRPDVTGARPSRRTAAFATLWCHGAPGIVLARIHAFRHLGDPRWLDDAVIAAHTTAKATQSLLDGGNANFSLCHGMAGHADCLIEAQRVLDPGRLAGELPGRVAVHGVNRYGDGAIPWPCGTHTEATPSLLLGLAGIGYFYLRTAMPALPSILMPVDVEPVGRGNGRAAR